MINLDKVLTDAEKTVYKLRGLYMDSGYQMYKMSKFEEYDLYAGNKDFLVSDGVITFNDTDGRLLALKPDVTLSIIKNTRDTDGVTKVFYNENVYRADKGTGSYAEIMQTGLEYIGEVGTEELSEVITLAKESLRINTDKFVLELSDMDLTEALVSSVGISSVGREKFLDFLREKNANGAMALALAEGVSTERAELLAQLVRFHAPLPEAIDGLSVFKIDEGCAAAVDSFTALLGELVRTDASSIAVDFSAVNNTRYYNGIAFRGFAEGAPSAVLLGGRYDKLMRRMKRGACAVGFAVYVDELARAGRKNG